jgi:hypothetical protein
VFSFINCNVLLGQIKAMEFLIYVSDDRIDLIEAMVLQIFYKIQKSANVFKSVQRDDRTKNENGYWLVS